MYYPRMDIRDRMRGGLWGVLVGDALGIPHQFKAATAIPERIMMVMPPSYPKTYRQIAYGTWSDDGAQTLALADSLVRKNAVDLDDFGARLQSWYVEGSYTVDHKSYDVGNGTAEAIARLIRGHNAREAGLTHERNNGNGSLMRTLPLALWHQGSDADLYRDAGLVSQVTHGHAISKAACGVYCVAARHMLNGSTPARAFIEGLRLAHIPLSIPSPPRGSGFVLDSLAFAIHAARSSWTYEETMLNAIRLGADTDTTAAIAGGLLGVRDGYEAIPSAWMTDLRGKGYASEIIDAFVNARHNV